jgi:hypothetical protein
VATAAHTQHAADENRQALMLCIIVVIFFICNFPRYAHGYAHDSGCRF